MSIEHIKSIQHNTNKCRYINTCDRNIIEHDYLYFNDTQLNHLLISVWILFLQVFNNRRKDYNYLLY